ncbi:MAG: carboxypeptidase-like regulatory domain-containing protein, partial [Bacteroidota bacterium]|nr:carboxypeptidase-like regulatory domain-containing protein [Bacteroidota bacterium]
MRNYVLLLFAIFISTISWAQNRGTINGKVTDDNGQPMPGATVTIRESGVSTISDNNGLFSFSNVRTGRATLVVSFVGFADREQTVNVGDEGVTNATLKLDVKARVGDEVVI